MNIAFDAGAIEIGKGSGIGNYTLNQFTEMIKMASDVEFFYFNTVEKSVLLDSIKEPNLHKEYLFMGRNDELRKYRSAYADVYGEIVQEFIRKNQIDVFYITSPFFADNVTYKKEWFDGVTVVATAWDIIPYVMRNVYLRDKNDYQWYMSCIDMLRWVDRLLAISNSVKDDMVKYLNFDADKIDVIYGGVSERFRKLNIAETEKKVLYGKFGIKHEYVLCCISADERKNVMRAIEAFANLTKTVIDEHQLVIVGRVLPEQKVKFLNKIQSLHMEDKILLTDYVTDEELLALYNLAKLMIFPSLYEGFGLPAIEAWACGTPVIASNNSSLGEIVGEAGLLFDPKDVNSIAKTMQTALMEADLARLLQKGQDKLHNFTWDKVAEASLKAINEALANKENTLRKVKNIALIYPVTDMGEIWNTLPEVMGINMCVDVYYQKNGNERPKSLDLEQLSYSLAHYDVIVLLAPMPIVVKKLAEILQNQQIIWLVADEELEEILYLIANRKNRHGNSISGADKASLANYFADDKTVRLTAFEKKITVNSQLYKDMMNESVDSSVYSVNPFGSLQTKYFDERLAGVLADNVYKAVFCDKPWGYNSSWQTGEQLLDDLSQNLNLKSYSISEIKDLAHTLGYAFGNSPFRLLPPGDDSSEVKNGKIQIDFVCTWNTKCGIAEYTRFYYDAIKEYVSVNIFANITDNLVRNDEAFVQGRFWSFHEHPVGLVNELLKSKAPIVHVQYTEGFFRTEDLIYLLEHISDKKKTVITCHNTAFLNPQTLREKQILNQATYVVHQEQDIAQLKRIGINPEKIMLIQHGQVVFSYEDKEEVRHILGIENKYPIVGSYGFLFPHKGVRETIEAIHLLKEEYPDIFYISCGSIYSDNPVSSDYYKSCQQTIKKFGLGKNVLMISDFLEAKHSAYILQASDVTVMAYGPTKESASGAVRFCAAAKRPLITTEEEIFDEFVDCSLQIKNNSPQCIANGIKEALNEAKTAPLLQEMIKKVEKNSWPVVAKEYMTIYTGLI